MASVAMCSTSDEAILLSWLLSFYVYSISIMKMIPHCFRHAYAVFGLRGMLVCSCGALLAWANENTVDGDAGWHISK